MKTLVKIVGFMVIALLALSASSVLAQIEFKATTELGGIKVGDELPEFGGYVENLYNTALAVSGILAVFMIVWGGVRYMASEAVTDKGDAKDQIQQAIYGLVLLLGSVIILNTLGLSRGEPLYVSQRGPIINGVQYSAPALFEQYSDILDEAAKIARDTGKRDYVKEAQGCATAVKYYQELVLQGVSGAISIQDHHTYLQQLARYTNCLNKAMQELRTTKDLAYETHNQQRTKQSEINFLRAQRNLSEAALFVAKLNNDQTGIKLYTDDLKEMDALLKKLDA